MHGADVMEAGQALRVLVVDDNHDQADTLALLLTLWGHAVQVAYDSATALAEARACPPDVALIDVGLPDSDGCALARQLRRERGLANVILIAVTGFSDEEHRLRSREAGFQFYLVKPADPAALERLLAALAHIAHGPNRARTRNWVS